MQEASHCIAGWGGWGGLYTVPLLTEHKGSHSSQFHVLCEGVSGLGFYITYHLAVRNPAGLLPHCSVFCSGRPPASHTHTSSGFLLERRPAPLTGPSQSSISRESSISSHLLPPPPPRPVLETKRINKLCTMSRLRRLLCVC